MVADLARQIDTHRRDILAPAGVVDDPHHRLQQLLGVQFLDHRQMAAFKHDQGTDRINADGADKGGNQRGIELGTPLVVELA